MQQNKDTTETKAPKWIQICIRIVAITAPIIFLLYTLYINYLPFGYSRTIVLDIGKRHDTNGARILSLEPTRDLGDMATLENATSTYRPLHGITHLIFNPGVILEQATTSVTIQGDNVRLLRSVAALDISNTDWQYYYDFTQNKPLATQGLAGTAFLFEGCLFFNQDATLHLPNITHDLRKDRLAFAVTWKPVNDTLRYQRIIGGTYWDLFQHNHSVRLEVRSPRNIFEKTIIDYPIAEDFFHHKHTAKVVLDFSHSIPFIEMVVDDTLPISQSVPVRDYTAFTQPMEEHGLAAGIQYDTNNRRFNGCLYNLAFSTTAPLLVSQDTLLLSSDADNQPFYFTIVSDGVGALHSATITIDQ
ncbi:MAG: hypothetical protein LR017_00695 [Candidatus Pacebacteria bacterium]|nr:hypothetical protein [Candidatus Paceibacterota bacterium]